MRRHPSPNYSSTSYFWLHLFATRTSPFSSTFQVSPPPNTLLRVTANKAPGPVWSLLFIVRLKLNSASSGLSKVPCTWKSSRLQASTGIARCVLQLEVAENAQLAQLLLNALLPILAVQTASLRPTQAIVAHKGLVIEPPIEPYWAVAATCYNNECEAFYSACCHWAARPLCPKGLPWWQNRHNRDAGQQRVIPPPAAV